MIRYAPGEGGRGKMGKIFPRKKLETIINMFVMKGARVSILFRRKEPG